MSYSILTAISFQFKLQKKLTLGDKFDKILIYYASQNQTKWIKEHVFKLVVQDYSSKVHFTWDDR